MAHFDLETVTLAGGCFWCTEAVMKRLNGVRSVVSGYMGGQNENPTYEQICTGATGHAEVIQVSYDSKEIAFTEILDVFWQMHDPTTLNRQGADVGTQYRSGIYYHSEEQKRVAEDAKEKLNQTAFHRMNPIVTEIVPASVFYKAEDYHQDYYSNHVTAGYCRAVISPKLKKLGLE